MNPKVDRHNPKAHLLGTLIQNADNMGKKRNFLGGPIVVGQIGKHFHPQMSRAEPGEESKKKCIGPLAFYSRICCMGTTMDLMPMGEKKRSFDGVSHEFFKKLAFKK